MAERYKSLAAMKAEPWIEHFQKTAGQTSLWSKKPMAVVIKPGKAARGEGQSVDGSSQSRGEQNGQNLPLKVVSPIEQSNEMAHAELAGKIDKNPLSKLKGSVTPQRKSGTQRIKRKTVGASGAPSKKIARINDIFTRHVKR